MRIMEENIFVIKFNRNTMLVIVKLGVNLNGYIILRLFSYDINILCFFFVEVPFYGETGLSAGVMLFNLTRIRALTDLSWTREVMAIFDEYRNKIVYADQDILNIFFSKVCVTISPLRCCFKFC